MDDSRAESEGRPSFNLGVRESLRLSRGNPFENGRPPPQYGFNSPPYLVAIVLLCVVEQPLPLVVLPRGRPTYALVHVCCNLFRGFVPQKCALVG